jgi:hypothetical protein
MSVVGADEELWETRGSSGLMFATPGDKVDRQYREEGFDIEPICLLL